MSWRFAVVVVVMLFSACGSGPTSGVPAQTPSDRSVAVSSVPAPASNADDSPYASASTLPQEQAEELLGSAPANFPPGECQLLLSEGVAHEFAFTAQRVEVLGRRIVARPDVGAPIMYRDLRFSNVEVLQAPAGVLHEGYITMTTVEALMPVSGVPAGLSRFDFTQLPELTNMIVLGETDAPSGGPVVSMLLAESEHGLTAGGSCTGPFRSEAGYLAARAGYADTFSFVRRWVTADDFERSAFEEAERRWYDEVVLGVPAASWEDQDPRTRSIRPELVPDSVRAELEVRGVIVDMERESDDRRAISFVTNDGISLTVGAMSDRGVLPLCYLPDSAGSLRVLLVEPGADAGTREAVEPIATIDAKMLEASGGLLVAGTASAPEVTVMSRAEVAAELGIDERDLEAIRERLLFSAGSD